jgi:hypothetical protein
LVQYLRHWIQIEVPAEGIGYPALSRPVPGKTLDPFELQAVARTFQPSGGEFLANMESAVPFNSSSVARTAVYTEAG